MNRKIVTLLMVLSVLVGAGGTYAALTWLGSNPASAVPSQQSQDFDITLEEPSKETAKDLDSQMAKIQQAYELISSRYVEEVESEKLIQGAIQGMVDTLEDPYSVYMDKETAD